MERIIRKLENICGRDNLELFYLRLRENLRLTPKENEKKQINIQLKGGDSEPSGIGISIKTVNKSAFKQYLSNEKDFMKDALMVITIKIGLKNESVSESFENLFNQLKPILDEVELIKPYKDDEKLDYFLSIENKTACFEIIIKEELAFRRLKELGLDFAEFENLQFKFKTDLKADEILSLKLEKIVEKMLTFIFSVDLISTNAKYLITVFNKTIDSLNITDENQNKRLKKMKLFFSGILGFMEYTLKLQFDPKELTRTLFSTKTVKESKEDVNSGLEAGKDMIESFAGDNARGMLQSFGAYEPMKETDFDEINISILSSQYKNGFAVCLNLPGITKFINEKILC